MTRDILKIKIALALSGGGVRATVFHLGSLLRIAEGPGVEFIEKISTVSGGSLAIGLIFSHSNLNWPTSDEYKNKVLPIISRILTTQSLQNKYILELLNLPWFQNPGQKFSKSLEKAWGIRGTLKDLPQTPEWFVNATSIQTGKNWRFSQKHMGDWVFGHNYEQRACISLALSASAAIPFMVGKVKLPISEEGWKKINPATDQPIKKIKPPAKNVYLWDGGVYENLGIEPLYKPQRGIVGDYDLLLVCDASKKLDANYVNPTGIFCKTPPFIRPPRLFDICSDQIRSLRSRQLMHEIIEESLNGSIIRLGNTVENISKAVIKSGNNNELALKNYTSFLSEAEVDKAANFPTHAKKLSMSEFLLLLRHGFETTDATLTGYQNKSFPSSIPFNYSF
jgi:NTE family protein